MQLNSRQSVDDISPNSGQNRSTATTSRLVALGALLAIGMLLCLYVAYPLLPALAWAVALATIAFPIHSRLDRALGNQTGAALLTTTLVVVAVLIPLVLTTGRLAQEVVTVSKTAQKLQEPGAVDEIASQVPGAVGAIEWIRANVDLPSATQRLATRFAGDASALAQGSAWAFVQLLVCVYVLFFALRDWRSLLASLRGMLPLADGEADYLFTRVSDSIHATVFATVMTSFLQGVLGGLLFWALGLPAPLVWGVVMFVLGVIPVLGAFLVWVPAAIYLAANDRIGAAIILVAWGLIMAGPVCNYVYASLAGGRMRMNEVPTLIAFVGGLAVFGVSGIVLGPVILVVTMGIIDLWRKRLTGGPLVDQPDPERRLITATV